MAETYKSIILQCPRHLMVIRSVMMCTSKGHWRGFPIYFLVLIRHQKHSGCQFRMEILSNKLPLTSSPYCGTNCLRTKGGKATAGLPIRTPSESSPLISQVPEELHPHNDKVDSSSIASRHTKTMPQWKRALPRMSLWW